jgi:hypothetical protein
MLFSLLVSLFALVVAGYLARYVLRQQRGTPEMQLIVEAIKEGAEAFLRRQYRTIGIMTVRECSTHQPGASPAHRLSQRGWDSRDRERRPRRQGVGNPQSGRPRRHGGGPVQRYHWTFAPCPDQIAKHHHPGAGSFVHLKRRSPGVDTPRARRASLPTRGQPHPRSGSAVDCPASPPGAG